MRGSYQLTKEEREKYIPYIKQCIKELETKKTISLNDTTLNPYNITSILEELGYEEVNFDSNGWEWDFWFTFVKNGAKDIVVQGCGITFDLQISLGGD